MVIAACQISKTAKFIAVNTNNTKEAQQLPLRRVTNITVRAREYLTTHEIEDLRKAAREIGRQGHRDDTVVLILFRHVFRVSEIISVKWEQIDLKLGLLHVQRIKNGIPSPHSLRGLELRAFRQLKRDNPMSPYVFVSERNAPLTTRAVRHIVARVGEEGKLGFTVHPHMLRHSTGFYLANEGQDTRAIQSMEHSNIKNMVIYTKLSPKRFNKFWSD